MLQVLLADAAFAICIYSLKDSSLRKEDANAGARVWIGEADNPRLISADKRNLLLKCQTLVQH